MKLIWKLIIGAWLIGYSVALVTLGAPYWGLFHTWVFQDWKFYLIDAVAEGAMLSFWMWYAIALAHINTYIDVMKGERDTAMEVV